MANEKPMGEENRNCIVCGSAINGSTLYYKGQTGSDSYCSIGCFGAHNSGWENPQVVDPRAENEIEKTTPTGAFIPEAPSEESQMKTEPPKRPEGQRILVK